MSKGPSRNCHENTRTLMMRGSSTGQRPSFTFSRSISLPVRRWHADAKSQRQESQRGDGWVEEAADSNPIWDFWAFQPISRADKEAEMCSSELLTLLHKYQPPTQEIHELKKVSRTPTTQLLCVGRTGPSVKKATSVYRPATQFVSWGLGAKLLNLSVPEFPTYKLYPHITHLVIMGINERINNGGSTVKRVIFLPLPFSLPWPLVFTCFAVNFIGISQNSLTGEKTLPL